MRFTTKTRGWNAKCESGLHEGVDVLTYFARTILSEPKFLGFIDNQIFLPMVLRYNYWHLFSLRNTSLDKIDSFVEKANNFHFTITIHSWDVRNRDHFLGHKSLQGGRFNKESILDVQTHYKPTETSQCTNFYSCHPPGVKKGFIKEEALRLLRANCSQTTFEGNIRNFQNRLIERGYPAAILRKYLSEVKFAEGKRTYNR